MESDRLLHNDGEDEVIAINQQLIKLNLLDDRRVAVGNVFKT